MQMFGLISLIISICIGVLWIVTSSGNVTTVYNEDGNVQSDSSYQGAIDSAHNAAGMLGGSRESSDNVVVYDDVAIPSDIEILNLSGKGMSGSLKAEIRYLSELKELDISNNYFTGLPAEVGQLSKLEVLNLSNNPFTGLPYELSNLKSLKVLDLRGTNYSEQDLSVIKVGFSDSVNIIVD